LSSTIPQEIDLQCPRIMNQNSAKDSDRRSRKLDLTALGRRTARFSDSAHTACEVLRRAAFIHTDSTSAKERGCRFASLGSASPAPERRPVPCIGNIGNRVVVALTQLYVGAHSVGATFIPMMEPPNWGSPRSARLLVLGLAVARGRGRDSGYPLPPSRPGRGRDSDCSLPPHRPVRAQLVWCIRSFLTRPLDNSCKIG